MVALETKRQTYFSKHIYAQSIPFHHTLILGKNDLVDHSDVFREHEMLTQNLKSMWLSQPIHKLLVKELFSVFIVSFIMSGTL